MGLRSLIVVAIIVFNIGLDQVSKTIVRRQIGYNEQISLIGNYFTLTRIENTGAFLSVGDSLPAPVRFIILTFLPGIALGWAVFYVFKTNLPILLTVGVCLAIGGGIGNLYDRIAYGSVTDFLYMDFVVFQTGIFNLADVSIMIGMIIILIQSFRNTKELKLQQS